ncbi:MULTISPECIES: H-NS histone family protein [Burkholderia]|uniref:Histone family protein nucleoid-structuring protein H-NS n=2 Tax=Burkholderia orbicola TaxID=2978683 RepID=B1K6A5_BURO0|nr:MULTISPECIES: H-NS histone family protein [Burkholderia]ABK11947.1 histone family protein nucleoid-structuring protein H-NS [Burkholderia cenocepacia HI2424]ACA94190.1 histone family protein nucleoid-structuring protein H-NS [Burkholderia orbicola MC0-3]EKS9845039.1 H-NS histone family protein [Burkholderia cepacia]MBJ9672734.1 H-NS histone family protein [Burkholderia cenocepacia]MBJ9879964.1 H-NS histone family protein [Burkholderia cenocepacia]
MASYKELKAQMDALAEKTEAARIAEFQAIVDDIRSKVSEYGINEKDIFGGRRGRPVAQTAKVPVEAKYRDPKTGATWSGRGRAPAWIKDVKNRNRFLIQE